MFSDESNNRITEKRVLYYIQLSKEAREKATPLAKTDVERENLTKMLRMFDDYLSDSEHFLEKGGFCSCIRCNKLRTCLDRLRSEDRPSQWSWR